MADTETQEETEPTADDNTQVDDAGVPGQILYPDRLVDAERAAAYAGGKEDTLYGEDDPRFYDGWQNPADDTRLLAEERKNKDEEDE